MGFEPTPAERNGLAVHRLNHSATSSVNFKYFYRMSYITYQLIIVVHILA